jgi:hypothetical protein
MRASDLGNVRTDDYQGQHADGDGWRGPKRAATVTLYDTDGTTVWAASWADRNGQLELSPPATWPTARQPDG